MQHLDTAEITAGAEQDECGQVHNSLLLCPFQSWCSPLLNQEGRPQAVSNWRAAVLAVASA